MPLRVLRQRSMVKMKDFQRSVASGRTQNRAHLAGVTGHPRCGMLCKAYASLARAASFPRSPTPALAHRLDRHRPHVQIHPNHLRMSPSDGPADPSTCRTGALLAATDPALDLSTRALPVRPRQPRRRPGRRDRPSTRGPAATTRTGTAAAVAPGLAIAEPHSHADQGWASWCGPPARMRAEGQPHRCGDPMKPMSAPPGRPTWTTHCFAAGPVRSASTPGSSEEPQCRGDHSGESRCVDALAGVCARQAGRMRGGVLQLAG